MASKDYEKGVYLYNGQYYYDSPSFPGTYRQLNPGKSTGNRISSGEIPTKELDPTKFREEPSSKSEIRAYYNEDYNKAIAEVSAQAQAGEITWDEAEARVAQARQSAGDKVDDYWAEREFQKAAQEQRNLAKASGGGGSGGISGGGDSMELPFESTGDPALDATLGSLQKYIQELEKRGQVLNPNIKLDAKTLAQFTKQAEQEIDPYYKGQLKMARESLLNSAGFSRDEVLRTEQELEQQYQTKFRETGESAADRGFALSGIRQREEGQLATDTQQIIDRNRRNLEFDTGNQARQFAQQYGTSNMPTLDIGAAPSITGGENKFSTNTGTRSLYQLDPGVYQGLIGSQEYEQRGAVRNRASQLEEAFRSNQGLQQQRSLTL